MSSWLSALIRGTAGTNETSSDVSTLSSRCSTPIQTCTTLESEESIKKQQDAEVVEINNTLSQLLEPFQSNKLPTLARTNPSIPPATGVAMTLSNLYQVFPFFIASSTTLTKALIKHALYGPAKPSWGIELSLFTAFLREAAAYSHLSSLDNLRSFLDLNSLLPTPKDGIVTPVSFRVKNRNLRGLLKEADSVEDGSREITGEWVINKRLFKVMQEEFKSRNGRSSSSSKASTSGTERIVLYLHGGAYYAFSAATHRVLTISVSRYTESRVFAINYRLAPETRFPGQLHDAVSAYMRLILDLKICPSKILLCGDSAGAGLVLATMMYLRDEGYHLPQGAILMSPWCDLTMSCESWTTNKPFDYLPFPNNDSLHPVKCLLGEDGIHKYLTHPYVSPLFGNFHDLPPLLIQAGEAEVLRDEVTLLAHKASLAGVAVTHEIFEDQVHVFQALTFLDASRKAFQSQRHFVKHTLPEFLAAKIGKKVDVDVVIEEQELDCAEIDEEILQDAHLVVRGQLEVESLPTSPNFATLDLPNKIVYLGEGLEEEEEDLDMSSSSSGEEEITSTLLPSATPPPLLPGFTTSSSSSVARPFLRAYSSARDLVMSQSNRVQDITERIRQPNSQSLSQASSNSIRFSSQEEEGSNHQHQLSSRNLRSTSHPDLRALLVEYETSGPSNSTIHFTPINGTYLKKHNRSSSSRSTPSNPPSAKRELYGDDLI